MLSRRRLALAVVLLAGVIALSWVLRSRRVDQGDMAVASMVPRDARAVVWLDSLADLLSALDQVALRLEGAEGIPKALALAIGVQTPTREGLAKAGFTADAGAALFLWQGAAWGCVALDASSGFDHVQGWLGQRGLRLVAASPEDAGASASGDDGWVVVRTVAHAASRAPNRGAQQDIRMVTLGRVWRLGPWLLFQAPLPERWRQLLGRESGQIAAKNLSSAGRFKAWREATKGLATSSPGAAHLRATLGAGDGVRPTVRRALGMASLLFGGVVDGVQGVTADLKLRGQALALRLDLPTAPKANADVAQYHDGFLAKDSAALALGDVLPDEVALWGRLHLNPRLLDMVPSFLRDRVLPRTLLSRLHPALAKVDARGLLLERLEGRLAVGLLGIDDKAPLDPRAWRRIGLQRALGGFLAGTLVKASDAAALQTAIREALAGAGEDVRTVNLGPWHGWRVTLMGTEVGLLRRGNALLVVAGQGELSRFERVARGRFPSLGKAARTPLERAMVSDQIGWIGVGSTTGRIARAARRRGVPDAFVRMVRSVAAITLGVRLDADGIHTILTLRPRSAATSGAEKSPSSQEARR